MSSAAAPHTGKGCEQPRRALRHTEHAAAGTPLSGQTAGSGFTGCAQRGQPRAPYCSGRQRAGREALAPAGGAQQQSRQKPQTAPVCTLAAGRTAGSSRESPTSATDTACDRDTQLAFASNPQQRFGKTPRGTAEETSNLHLISWLSQSHERACFGKAASG